MKIQSSKGRAHISVNPRGTGQGVVVQQGQHKLLMSWSEWREVRDAIDMIYNGRPPVKSGSAFLCRPQNQPNES